MPMAVDHLHHDDRGRDRRLRDSRQKANHAQGNDGLCRQSEELSDVGSYRSPYRQRRGKNAARDTGKISHYRREKTRDRRVPGRPISDTMIWM